MKRLCKLTSEKSRQHCHPTRTCTNDCQPDTRQRRHLLPKKRQTRNHSPHGRHRRNHPKFRHPGIDPDAKVGPITKKGHLQGPKTSPKPRKTPSRARLEAIQAPQGILSPKCSENASQSPLCPFLKTNVFYLTFSLGLVDWK